jgi:hypothetical protein
VREERCLVDVEVAVATDAGKIALGVGNFHGSFCSRGEANTGAGGKQRFRGWSWPWEFTGKNGSISAHGKTT